MTKIHPLKYYDEQYKEVLTIYVDGYGINDRPFEGLMFRFKWNEKIERYKFDGFDRASDARYFSEFNEKMWIEAAEDYVSDYDYAEDKDGAELVRGEYLDPNEVG